MIEKASCSDGRRVEVRFSVPAAYGPLSVVGDFNDWNPRRQPLVLDGARRTTTIVLEAGHRYEFRYVSPTGSFCNDEDADDYAVNDFGGFNCVLDLTEAAASARVRGDAAG